MRSLLRYVLKNYAFLLFVLLEVISLTLIFSFNSYQRSKYLNSSNQITGSIYNSYNSVVNYFGLKAVNRQLAEENARLKTLLDKIPEKTVLPDSAVLAPVFNDSLYRFVAARVINNSVNKQYNYITLNKGSRDGIKVDQGIINPDGVVGVITHVTESFSMGFSVLNRRWGVSARLKESGTFGPLSWDGNDYRYAHLNGIPFHVEIAVGDTVETSSYSSVFPEGIMVGTIHQFEKPQGENYFKISVKLAVNFKAITYVDVIENLKKPELLRLDKMKMDDPLTN